MATGTVVVLDDVLLSFDGTNINDQLKNVDVSVTANMNDSTSFDSAGWEESTPGLKNWSVNLDAMNSD